MNQFPKIPMGGSEQQYFNVSKIAPEHINLMLNHFDKVHGKTNIHWQHQYHDQQSVLPIRNDIGTCVVFVSNHQKQLFEQFHGIPHEKSVVIPNGIHPFDDISKEAGKINLIYTSTPFRGLSVLVASLSMLLSRNPALRDIVKLDVFSDMSLYGRSEENSQYEGIFAECRKHPNIELHGVVPPETLREYLKKAHIMSYPCIWEETFCISVVEAMAAGVLPVISDIGALPEICGRYPEYYSPLATDIYQKNRMYEHCVQYSYVLERAILDYLNNPPLDRLQAMRSHVNYSYSWANVLPQWKSLFDVFVRKSDV